MSRERRRRGRVLAIQHKLETLSCRIARLRACLSQSSGAVLKIRLWCWQMSQTRRHPTDGEPVGSWKCRTQGSCSSFLRFMLVEPSLCGGCVFVQAHRKDGRRSHSQTVLGEQAIGDPTTAAARPEWRGVRRLNFRTERRKVIRQAQCAKPATHNALNSVISGSDR